MDKNLFADYISVGEDGHRFVDTKNLFNLPAFQKEAINWINSRVSNSVVLIPNEEKPSEELVTKISTNLKCQGCQIYNSIDDIPTPSPVVIVKKVFKTGKGLRKNITALMNQGVTEIHVFCLVQKYSNRIQGLEFEMKSLGINFTIESLVTTDEADNGYAENY